MLARGVDRDDEAANPFLGSVDPSRPLLVCRWRLAGGRLPMANRHMRALRDRELAGRPVPPPLVAWAREHVDWTLERGAAQNPNGVLMLVVDERFHAVMAVGPYQPPASTALRSLVRRAQVARRESEATRVAPETIWLVRGDRLEWLDDRTNIASGTATLVRDLAQTVGLSVSRRDDDLRPDQLGNGRYDQAFLVSDEHGVVVPNDRPSAEAERFASGYLKLLDSTMRRQGRREQSGR